MSASLSHTGLPHGIGRFDLLAVFELSARAHFGLSRTAVALVRHYVQRTSDQDYTRGEICAVWSKVCSTAEALGLTPRSINAAERELEAAGFVKRTTGRNGARSGRREGGKVAWAAGINLAPLIERYRELKAGADAIRHHHGAIAKCRAEIRNTNRAIRAQGSEKLNATAEQILPAGRSARIADLAQLEVIRDALAGVMSALKAPLPPPTEEAIAPDHHEPRAQKTSGASEENGAPIQSKNIQKSCSAHCSASSVTPTDQPSCKPAHSIAITPRLAMELATAEYRETLAMIGAPTWPNIVTAASWTAPTIGIDQRTWGKACERFGREQAALCVIIIQRNAMLPHDHRYHARQPAQCLAGMMRKAGAVGVNFNGLIAAMLGDAARRSSKIRGAV